MGGGGRVVGRRGRLVEEQKKPLRQNVIVSAGADDTLLGHRGGSGPGGGASLCVDGRHLRGAHPTFLSTFKFFLHPPPPKATLCEISGGQATPKQGRDESPEPSASVSLWDTFSTWNANSLTSPGLHLAPVAAG